MQQFQLLNRQQQPYIQTGYGALGKLNTLLGIGSRPMPVGGGGAPGGMPAGGRPDMSQLIRTVVGGGAPGGGDRPMYRPTPGGGGSNLSRLLKLRAMNGDTEAARILGGI